MPELYRLPLIHASAELSGVAPLAFERAARSAVVGDRVHLGLLRVALVIARHALGACAPPSARIGSLGALDVCEAWTESRVGVDAVKRARSEAFAALIALERSATDAVRAATESALRGGSAFDAHADSVVRRFVGLGAHFAGSSAVLCLDAVTAPGEIALIPQQASGAMAYSTVGMGLARSTQLRTRSLDQAKWEAERGGGSGDHAAAELAIQSFHESLGAAWKDVSDGMRAHFFEFAEWALPAELGMS